MILQVAPPMANVGSQGTLAAASCLCASSIFTFLPEASVLNSPQVVMNYEVGGFYSQRTGKWYPNSRKRTDGFGRIVGDDEVTERPDPWIW